MRIFNLKKVLNVYSTQKNGCKNEKKTIIKSQIGNNAAGSFI